MLYRLFPLAALVSILLSFNANAQFHPTEPARYQRLPPLREQAALLESWRQERLDALPELMREHGVDVWLMSMREHAEDTLWWSVKPPTTFAAHRRTILLLRANTSALAGAPNPLTWVDNTGTVWPELTTTLAALNPTTIAINIDADHAFAGGLHVGELAALRRGLGPRWASRFVATPPALATAFVARRVPGMHVRFAEMTETVWAMLEEAFSERVVVPGRTTTEDLEWWFRDQMQILNVSTWNQPRVKVLDADSFPGWAGSGSLIREGDVLHVDFGISALGMHTDTQHLGYVLRASEGEREPPRGLLAGMRAANRLQDIVLDEMRVGRTGNEILAACNNRMTEEGIEGQVYTHPISDFAHGPGATIGFTNLPEFVPVYGELKLLPDTYYSIELFARHFVPERNESLRFMLEENVAWNNKTERWEYVRGRQERFHIVDAAHSRSKESLFQMVNQA